MGRFKNPWGEGGSERNNDILKSAIDEPNAAEYSSFSASINLSSLVSAARELGASEKIIASYRKFQSGSWSWFFSKNPNLSGAYKNDINKLETWEGWDTITSQKRTVLLNLADLDENPTRNAENLQKLIDALSKWPKSYRAIFWGGGLNGEEWTCNIFVGEAIYWAGLDTSKNGKYRSAKDIHSDQKPFSKVKKENLKAGHIVTLYGGTHTEIITNVPLKFELADDGFCSIGAGRSNIDNIGLEICDTATTFSDSREIGNPDNAYHSV